MRGLPSSKAKPTILGKYSHHFPIKQHQLNQNQQKDVSSPLQTRASHPTSDDANIRESQKDPRVKYRVNPVTKRKECIEPGCGKDYAAVQSLQYHVQQHHWREQGLPPPGRVKCDARGCGEDFSTERALRKHTKDLHSDGRPAEYLCSDCDMTYHKNTQLRSHQWYAHKRAKEPATAGPDARFKCDDPACHGKSFPTRKALVGHISGKHRRKEAGESYTCKHCGRRWRDQESLELHVSNKHQGPRNKRQEGTGGRGGEGTSGRNTQGEGIQGGGKRDRKKQARSGGDGKTSAEIKDRSKEEVRGGRQSRSSRRI